MQRRKISAVTQNYLLEIKRLRRFDKENQARFSNGDYFTLKEIHFLTEAIFFRAFRAYERFLRDLFLLYSQEKQSTRRKRIKSYIKPKSFAHSEKLIRSSMHHIDWSNPDVVIQRAEIYLVDGAPFKATLNHYRNELQQFRKIRNHIAHDSEESLRGFKDVLRQQSGYIPLVVPTPGELLLQVENVNADNYKLLRFFDILSELAVELG